MRTQTHCPNCKADLDDVAVVSLYAIVPADQDPQGQARADLIFECVSCGKGYNAFVALSEFFSNPINVNAQLIGTV